MSTAMHTPGPWNVFAGDNYQVRSPLMPREFPHRFKSDSTGDFVAYVGNHAADFGEANAHLIAAAPDMLAALEQIMSDGYPSIKWWDDARAAIAKAKGGAA